MARIRTLKPEAFASESLAEVSLTAERTFFGLLTQADDHGRFRDQPAVITGLLWSLRPEHGPVEVEDDLNQLAAAGLVCRYQGGDGKRYLHVITFTKHQKINRPSGIRHPHCPDHEGERPETGVAGRATGAAEDFSSTAHEGLSEDSVTTHGGLTESSASPHCELSEPPADDNSPGQQSVSEGSVSTHGALSDGSVSPHCPDLGSRNGNLGSPPPGGAAAPAPDSVSAQQLIGEYTAACTHRPPNSVLGQLGRETAKLLAEGISPTYVRDGLARHRTKGLHPSTLASLVHEAMNAAAPSTGSAGLVRPDSRPTVPAHRAWANPADPAAAYAEEL